MSSFLQPDEEEMDQLRRRMVDEIELEFGMMAHQTGRPNLKERVRRALLKVPRHLFVPPEMASIAYQDQPLPIGFDKTISQPSIAALMIDQLDLAPADHVLEVGTGLGYQAALLADLARHVWTIDVVEEFAEAADELLGHLGFDNVTVRIGNGARGWADAAPFDAILVTAAMREMPLALVRQLRAGGRLVAPLGAPGAQRLTRVTRHDANTLLVEASLAVEFTALETIF